MSMTAFLTLLSVWLLFAQSYPDLAWDFPAFYVAANLPLDQTYDYGAVQAFGEDKLKSEGIDYYPPYLRPAVFALLTRPVMQLPFWTAFIVWAWGQVAAYLLLLYLLYREFPAPYESLPLFALFLPPFLGLLQGQDPVTTPLLLTAFLLLLRRDKQTWAGIVLALALYKFTLVLLLPALLCVRGYRRALTSFVTLASALTLASVLLNPPSQYLGMLSGLNEWALGYTPENAMMSLRALSAGLNAPAVYWLLAPLTAGLSLWGLNKLPLEEATCTAMMGAMLSAYHLGWYDGAALALPCVIGFWRGNRASKLLATALLIALPIWAFAKPAAAGLAWLFWLSFLWPALRAQAPAFDPGFPFWRSRHV